MHRHFETELKDLKEQLVGMGGHVEQAVEISTQALIQRQPAMFKQVHELESRINREHIEVDESCLQLLARQSPLATDLRLVIAILKISTDLERMGDQAVNIAYNAKDYLESGEPIKELTDIPKMATEVRAMVRDALDAFVRQDRKLAEEVLLKDDQVDDLKDKVFHELIEYMTSNPTNIEPALDLILIARNLERLGDHATNIAEDVIFAVSGDDIRHGGTSSHKPKS
ncbi:MAG TPA: phosphate signaling complex protein PhoU [Bdellovibrionota bacterium]|jgi:phosphate transport system protein